MGRPNNWSHWTSSTTLLPQFVLDNELKFEFNPLSQSCLPHQKSYVVLARSKGGYAEDNWPRAMRGGAFILVKLQRPMLNEGFYSGSHLILLPEFKKIGT
jgi:hypothetical protein